MENYQMELLRELLITEEKKTKKKKGDKSADKYFTHIAGNMLFKNTCSGELSGDKKIEKDMGI